MDKGWFAENQSNHAVLNLVYRDSLFRANRNAITATAAKGTIYSKYLTRIHLKQGLCGAGFPCRAFFVPFASINFDFCKLHNQPLLVNLSKPDGLYQLASAKPTGRRRVAAATLV
jgi:hypothetical protein